MCSEAREQAELARQALVAATLSPHEQRTHAWPHLGGTAEGKPEMQVWNGGCGVEAETSAARWSDGWPRKRVKRHKKQNISGEVQENRQRYVTLVYVARADCGTGWVWGPLCACTMGESGQLSAGRHQIGLFAATLFVAVVAALALANVCLQRRKRWISAAAARSPWPCLRLPPSEAWPLVATVTVAGLATFACVCYAADPVFTGMVVACVALDAASWIAAAAAVALQSARTTIPTCSLPTFWALSLGVKLYALIGVPGYSPPSDTDVSAALDPRPAGYAGFTGSTAHLIPGSRLAGVQWSMVAVEAALVVLGWCCCCAGMGVHVDIVAADDGGATAGGQPRQRVELSSEKRSKSSGTPLLGSPDAVERGRAGLAGDESKATAAGARAPPNPQRTRVNAGLKPAEVESFYDGFGRLQDAEAALYMDHAKRNLRTAASSTLKTANVVVEIGCGTGALAAKLLEQDLSPTCRHALHAPRWCLSLPSVHATSSAVQFASCA